MSVNSRLKANKIIGRRKAFYRERIPESNCARKETVDIDILVTSSNGHRKIMQSIRFTSCNLTDLFNLFNLRFCVSSDE